MLTRFVTTAPQRPNFELFDPPPREHYGRGTGLSVLSHNDEQLSTFHVEALRIGQKQTFGSRFSYVPSLK